MPCAQTILSSIEVWSGHKTSLCTSALVMWLIGYTVLVGTMHLHSCQQWCSGKKAHYTSRSPCRTRQWDLAESGCSTDLLSSPDCPGDQGCGSLWQLYYQMCSQQSWILSLYISSACVCACICVFFWTCVMCMRVHACICSAQSRNLRNLEIVLSILRFQKLCANSRLHSTFALSRGGIKSFGVVRPLLKAVHRGV